MLVSKVDSREWQNKGPKPFCADNQGERVPLTYRFLKLFKVFLSNTEIRRELHILTIT